MKALEPGMRVRCIRDDWSGMVAVCPSIGHIYTVIDILRIPAPGLVYLKLKELPIGWFLSEYFAPIDGEFEKLEALLDTTKPLLRKRKKEIA